MSERAAGACARLLPEISAVVTCEGKAFSTPAAGSDMDTDRMIRVTVSMTRRRRRRSVA